MAQKKTAYPVTTLTGGLNVSKDPLLITDAESPENLECRFGKGLLKKEFGKVLFGTKVLGVPMFLDVFYLSNGTSFNTLFTTTSAYYLNTTVADWIDITRGSTICDCETAWTASANVTATASTDVKKGTYSSKLAIAAGFTTGLAAYKDISSTDFSPMDHIHLWIKSSVATTAGQLQLVTDTHSGCVSPAETVNIPALVANTWTRVSIAFTGTAATISVGLNVAADLGAMNVYIDDIKAVYEYTGSNLNLFFSTTFIDKYVITNGKDALEVWDGTGNITLLGVSSGPSRANTVCTYMSHLLVGGTTEGGTNYPFRVRWADAGTVDDWDTGSYGYVDLVDTVDQIVHIKLLLDQCIVYKDYSIWKLNWVGGDSVYTPQLMVDGSGTMAPNTIVNTGSEHVFYSNGEISVFNGNTTKNISTNINPLLFKTGDKIIGAATIARATALSLAETNTYVLSFPEEKIMFKGDLDDPATWTRHNDKEATTLGYYSSSDATAVTWATGVGTWLANIVSWRRRNLPSGAPTMTMGWNDGQVWEDDRVTTSTDEMVWVTKDFLFGHAHKMVEVRLNYRYGGCALWYSIDGGVTYVSLGSLSYASNWTEGVKYFNETADRVRFKLTTSEPVIEIRWIEPWYVPRLRSKTLSMN